MRYEDVDALPRVPHYARKTISHSAAEYLNHEQDVIRQSFSTGNHTWIKEALPAELGPDSLNLHRRQRMERNRLAVPVPQTRTKIMQLWGGGVYQEFEYIPDEQERRAALEKQARLVAKMKREKIAKHDWRHASQERRLKHETMIIHDPRSKDGFPYLGGDKNEELETAKPWLRHGDVMTKPCDWRHEQYARPADAGFLAGKGNGLDDDSRGSRMTLPTIVERLQKRIASDWEGSTVAVGVTDQDVVQVAFYLATVDSTRGVHAYMNVLAKDVDVLGNLGLRKVGQLWGHTRDFAQEEEGHDADSTDSEGASALSSSLETKWMFFLLQPKWVKMRPTDAYYTIQPRCVGSGFLMSTAGSSVVHALGPVAAADGLSGSLREPGVPRPGPPHSARNTRSAPGTALTGGFADSRGRGGGAGGAAGPGAGAGAGPAAVAGKPDISHLLGEAKSYLPSIAEARRGPPTR